MKVVLWSGNPYVALSNDAILALLAEGVPVYTYDQNAANRLDADGWQYTKVPKTTSLRDTRGIFVKWDAYNEDIVLYAKYFTAWANRTDPALVKVVEQLGDKAAKYEKWPIRIIEIPDDVNFRVSYDSDTRSEFVIEVVPRRTWR